jgi:hypothetical protein
MKFIPRINLKFDKPIRQLVKELTNSTSNDYWKESVAEIWINESSWKQIFASPEF